MEYKCKKPISDTGGNPLFVPSVVYKIISENKAGMVQLKDELGGLRWFIIKGNDGSFFREHFEKAKEQKE